LAIASFLGLVHLTSGPDGAIGAIGFLRSDAPAS
jgi:hypothetical protein